MRLHAVPHNIRRLTAHSRLQADFTEIEAWRKRIDKTLADNGITPPIAGCIFSSAMLKSRLPHMDYQSSDWRAVALFLFLVLVAVLIIKFDALTWFIH